MTVSRTICIGFLTVIGVGTILLLLPWSTSSGAWNDPITALFTATSAVCVTGLIVVDTGTFYSFWGQACLILLIQVGGLGYMTATTFLLLLLGRRFGLKDRLALQKSLDTPGLSGVINLVKSIIALTLVFELSGVFLLLPTFVPEFGWDRGLWLAVFHSVSSFNNAGFSLFSDSLVRYVTHPFINLVVPLLIIFGGLGYQVIMELFLWVRDRLMRKCERAVLSLHCKLVTSTTLLLLILGTIAFLATEFNNPSTFGALRLDQKFMAAWFQSVTTRTAGFNTVDIGQMRMASLFLTIAFMFVGASPGSTGGGIKTTTMRVLFSCTNAVLRGKEEVLAYQRQIPMPLILKAISIVVGSVMTMISVTVLVALASPQLDFIQILFEAVSAFGTVGLSTGITADVSVLTRLILIVTMYVGRVGVLLMMSAIVGDPPRSSISYPEEDFLVG